MLNKYTHKLLNKYFLFVLLLLHFLMVMFLHKAKEQSTADKRDEKDKSKMFHLFHPLNLWLKMF